MQRSKRNTIGNQTFMLMFFLLMIDMGLHGFGIKWLAYPMNVMVIITACMILYLVRAIADNAYVPPETQQPRFGIRTAILLVFTVALSAVLAFSLQRSLSANSEITNDNSAIVLMIVSGVGLFIVAVVSIIKKANDKNDQDN